MPEALLPRIAKGDMSAVGEFLSRHTKLVLGLARRHFRSLQDAEDAVQDVFVDVWRSAGRFDANQGSETTFLLTVARRRLIDRLRKLGRQPATELLEDPTTLTNRDAESANVAVENRDEASRAHEALQQLRPEQRQVLELALGQGQTHHEISVSVGIPLGTVKSHARRGLTRLRELLGVTPRQDGGS